MDKSSYNYNEGPEPLGGSTSRVIRKRPQTNIKLQCASVLHSQLLVRTARRLFICRLLRFTSLFNRLYVNSSRKFVNRRRLCRESLSLPLEQIYGPNWFKICRYSLSILHLNRGKIFSSFSLDVVSTIFRVENRPTSNNFQISVALNVKVPRSFLIGG